MSNKQNTQSENYAARTAYRNEKIATQYDQKRFSSWRGRLGDWLDKQAFRSALSYLPQTGGMILDIPCGTGRASSWSVEIGQKVIGADVSAEMIAVARERLNSSYAPLGYVHADATHLPFRSKSLSCVTTIRFLGHIPPAIRSEILREMARVSQRYIIADYCISNPIINLRRRLDYWFRGKSWGFAQNWGWQSIPKYQLENEFQLAGLKAVKWFAKVRFLSDAWIILLERKDM